MMAAMASLRSPRRMFALSLETPIIRSSSERVA
jgi:hypothetical protein